MKTHSLNAVVTFLRSEFCILIAITFILIVQIEHTVTNYIFIPQNLHSMAYFYAIVIEFAVLMLIVNGHDIAGKLYALASLLTNILYYRCWTGSFEIIANSMLISFMLAGSLWFFSDLFVSKLNNKKHYCKLCPAHFDTPKELNGHVSAAHKRKPKKS